MDVAEQLQLLDRRVAYLEELTAHKEAVTDEFSEVVEFPSENPEDIANFCQWKMEKWWTMDFFGGNICIHILCNQSIWVFKHKE